MSDITKIIPPPRHGPRWVDLLLAAVAGGLLTLLLIGVLMGGGLSRFAGTTNSPSPSVSASASPLPSVTVQTAAPTTQAPTATPSPTRTAAPGTAKPTVTPTTAPPTTPRTNNPAPTKTP